MNSTKPKTTIVITSFNRPKCLKRAIESALSQTYSNLEILVVDDASEKDISEVKNAFQNTEVRFLQNTINRGACYSRNRGLNAAQGDYINFLDDDDELYPNKIDLQIKAFQASNDPELGMVTCHLLDCRSGKEKLIRNDVRGNIYKKLLADFAVAGTETMLFKKSVFDEIEGFDEHMESSQEYDLFIRASEKFTIDYVDKILTRKNRSENQISLNFDKKIQGATYLFQKHDARYRAFGFLFWLRMRLKLRFLLTRFMIGKWLGEKAYRFTIRK